jgi:outer membrane protein OmpA-like peptidoglycan-associated protein
MRFLCVSAGLLVSLVSLAQIVKNRVKDWDIRFATAEWTLDSADIKIIETVCTHIESRDNYKIRLIGSTDSIGSHESNLRLSIKRAEAVKTALLACGVADSLITMHGYSYDRPMSDNLTESNRQRNRRTNVHLTIVQFPVSALKPVEALRPGATFDLKVLFKFNTTEFQQGSTKNLDTIIALLILYPELRFEIQGWTAIAQSNGDLSGERAKAVYDYMASHGIPADRMRWKGMGGAGCSEQMIEKCRRVEIVIIRNPYLKEATTPAR